MSALYEYEQIRFLIITKDEFEVLKAGESIEINGETIFLRASDIVLVKDESTEAPTNVLLLPETAPAAVSLVAVNTNNVQKLMRLGADFLVDSDYIYLNAESIFTTYVPNYLGFIDSFIDDYTIVLSMANTDAITRLSVGDKVRLTTSGNISVFEAEITSVIDDVTLSFNETLTETVSVGDIAFAEKVLSEATGAAQTQHKRFYLKINLNGKGDIYYSYDAPNSVDIGTLFAAPTVVFYDNTGDAPVNAGGSVACLCDGDAISVWGYIGEEYLELNESLSDCTAEETDADI